MNEMINYNSIREQLRIEVNTKYQSTVDLCLLDIESKGLQDTFCIRYNELLDNGHHPYDCLIIFLKGVEY